MAVSYFVGPRFIGGAVSKSPHFGETHCNRRQNVSTRAPKPSEAFTLSTLAREAGNEIDEGWPG
jgi:hypothetical protein